MRLGVSRSRALNASLAALLCAAAAGLFGCGSGDSDDGTTEPTANQAADTKAVIAIGSQLNRAFKKKNAVAICGLIAPAALEAQYKTKKACVRQLNVALARNDTESPNFKINSVTIDGDTASAESNADVGKSLDFKKVDGKWYLDISSSDAETEAE